MSGLYRDEAFAHFNAANLQFMTPTSEDVNRLGSISSRHSDSPAARLPSRSTGGPVFPRPQEYDDFHERDRKFLDRQISAPSGSAKLNTSPVMKHVRRSSITADGHNDSTVISSASSRTNYNVGLESSYERHDLDLTSKAMFYRQGAGHLSRPQLSVGEQHSTSSSQLDFDNMIRESLANHRRSGHGVEPNLMFPFYMHSSQLAAERRFNSESDLTQSPGNGSHSRSPSNFENNHSAGSAFDKTSEHIPHPGFHNDSGQFSGTKPSLSLPQDTHMPAKLRRSASSPGVSDLSLAKSITQREHLNFKDKNSFAHSTKSSLTTTPPSQPNSVEVGQIPSTTTTAGSNVCDADSTKFSVPSVVSEVMKHFQSTTPSSMPVEHRRSSAMSGISDEGSRDGADMLGPDVKLTMMELCPVCGDKVSGYHYGLLTCESCKGFFKRTVQNKKVYSCVDNQACLIDKAQRKRCPSCRFQKCIQVGMKVEAVRTDRMRGGRNKFGPLYKRDRAMKMQAAQTHNIIAQQQTSDSFKNGQFDFASNGTGPYPYLVTPKSELGAGQNYVNAGLLGLAPEMRGVIPTVARELQDNEIDSNEMGRKMLSFAKVQLEQSAMASEGDVVLFGCHLIDYLLLILVEWSRTAIYFKECSVDDQMKVIQASWSELVVVEFVYSLTEQDSWSLACLEMCAGQYSPDSLIDSLNLTELRDRVIGLKAKMEELQFDNIDYSCLKYLILFNPDITSLEDKHLIEKTQEKINAGLFDYSLNFFSHIPDKFGQLLLRLPEIRLISIRLEEFLFERYMDNGLSRQSLLVELLRSKKLVAS